MTLFGVLMCINFTHPPQPAQCFMISNPRGFLSAEECETELERLRRLAAHGQLPLDPIDGQRMGRYTELSCQTFQRVN